MSSTANANSAGVYRVRNKTPLRHHSAGPKTFRRSIQRWRPRPHHWTPRPQNHRIPANRLDNHQINRLGDRRAGRSSVIGASGSPPARGFPCNPATGAPIPVCRKQVNTPTNFYPRLRSGSYCIQPTPERMRLNGLTPEVPRYRDSGITSMVPTVSVHIFGFCFSPRSVPLPDGPAIRLFR